MKKLAYLICALFIVFGCSKSDDTNGVQESNWKVLETPTTNDLTDIHFSSNDFGLACGSSGTFLKTENAGETWQSLDVGVGYSFLSVFALNENEFYTSRTGLYKTTDSGVSFNEIGDLSSFGASISDILFFNSKNGIINKGSAVYLTNDGGTNWLSVYAHKGDARILEGTNNNTVYLAGGITFDSVDSGELHKSTDNGETWEVMNLPLEIAGSQITAIDFLNSQVGYISTFENKIYKTNDGGESWIEKTELSFGPINDLVFIDENNGYLISQNKVYASKDGGAGWDEEYQTETANHLTSILAAPNGTIYTSVMGGTILKKD